MLESICPIFPSLDFRKTAGFYRSLGFMVAFEYEAEGYLILTRDEIEVHFFRAQSHDPAKSNHGAFVRVKDANELSKELNELGQPKEGIPRVGTAEERPWGICEFGIVDPDGNLLRLGHILK